ncbi:hypothetical protein BJ742DRAFT_802599 [Cladochytrium replicatum]|nr:hypothetical protein BJ742DRAFT_802599 [Cladochytrium replicatum]
MTVASTEDTRPVWNHSFLLPISMLEFWSDTGIIIEFYRDPPVVRADTSDDASVVEEGDISPGRPINDLVGYCHIPLGDFTVLSAIDAGTIKTVDNLRVHLLGSYSKLPGSTHLFCSVTFKIPVNWNQLVSRPLSVTLKCEKPEEAKNAPANGGDEPKMPIIRNRKKTDSLPDMEFDQLIEAVKNERGVEFSISMNPDTKQTAFTHHDIEQRQRLIDRLLEELDARALAIKRIGQDLSKERDINCHLQQTIRDLRQQVENNQIKTNKLLNTVDIDAVPYEELKRRYAVLAEKLSREIIRGREMNDRLELTQAVAIEKNEIEKQFLELQHAHTSQQLYVQKLQDKCADAAKYKRAIRKQEEVIQKLEVLIKNGVGKDGSELLDKLFESIRIDTALFDTNLYKVLTEENRKLKQKLLDLQKWKHHQSKTEKTERSSHNLTQQTHSDEPTVLKLIMRAETAEARSQALEQELITSSKAFARQLAEMKAKLLSKDAYFRLGATTPVPREIPAPFMTPSTASSASSRSSSSAHTRKTLKRLDPL